MVAVIIALAAFLAARGLYRHLAVSRVERAAPDVLAALIELRGNLSIANRGRDGQALRDAADAAIYKALGIVV